MSQRPFRHSFQGRRSQSRPRPAQPRLIALNKPFGVLSQFTGSADERTLKEWIQEPNFYPAGRLDKDSEGLLLLTNDGVLQHRISHPSQQMEKTYWAQVEGTPSSAALKALRQGVELKDGMTLPATVQVIEEPLGLWPRVPPVRERKTVPDSWLQLTITEGRNRQVRRMTAAVGLPTLRLIRASIGPWKLEDLQPGEWRELSPLW